MNTTIHGFTLRMYRRDGYLYAQRRIGKKLHSVYVGKDPAKAQEKIERYLAKHGIARPGSDIAVLQSILDDHAKRIAAIEATLSQYGR